MPTPLHTIIDLDEYKDLQEKYRLPEASLDSTMDTIEIERLPMKHMPGVDVILFSCPFTGVTSCEYSLAEPLLVPEEAEEDIEFMRTAAAAHVVTEHI